MNERYPQHLARRSFAAGGEGEITRGTCSSGVVPRVTRPPGRTGAGAGPVSREPLRGRRTTAPPAARHGGTAPSPPAPLPPPPGRRTSHRPTRQRTARAAAPGCARLRQEAGREAPPTSLVPSAPPLTAASPPPSGPPALVRAGRRHRTGTGRPRRTPDHLSPRPHPRAPRESRAPESRAGSADSERPESPARTDRPENAPSRPLALPVTGIPPPPPPHPPSSCCTASSTTAPCSSSCAAP